MAAQRPLGRLAAHRRDGRRLAVRTGYLVALGALVAMLGFGLRAGSDLASVEALAPPVANDDVVITDEDTPIVINVLANDSDPDGDPLRIETAGDPSNGTWSFNGSDSFTYTPNADFNGNDRFFYTIGDGTGETDRGDVFITVNPVNDPPVAEADRRDIDEDSDPIVIDVLANDSDVDGDSLRVIAAGDPQAGSWVFTSPGTFTYTPAPDFTGGVAWGYRITDDNGGTAQSRVDVFITSQPPVAGDDSATTPEDTPVDIPVLDNDADPDGDPLVVVSVGNPSNGTAASNAGGGITYTPDPDFNGTDTFSYEAALGPGEPRASATVTVTVDPVNDPPVALADRRDIDEDSDPIVIDVLANDSDVDGDSLRVIAAGDPQAGSWVFTSPGTFTYTPAPDFTGGVAWGYRITDDNGGTAQSRVDVFIAAVNDPPVANDDSATTDEDVPVDIDVLANDTDVDGDSLTVAPSSISTPSNGTAEVNAAGGITYTPSPNFSGADSFTYDASDGNGGTATATVDITVNFVAGVDRLTVLASPCPLYDSTTAGGTLNGPIPANTTRTVQVTGPLPADQGVGTGTCVPATASAVIYTVTAKDPLGVGNLRLSETGVVASGGVVNYIDNGLDNANTVTVPVGSTGRADLFANSSATGVRLVAVGYYGPTGTLRYNPLTPCAVADSRPREGAIGSFAGPFAAGAAYPDITVTGSFSPDQGGGNTTCGVPAGAAGVVVNLVSVRPTGGFGGSGFLAAGTGGTDPSEAGTPFADLALNNATSAYVPLTADGTVAIDVEGLTGTPSSHVRVVVLGYLATDSGDDYVAVNPCAGFDTRPNEGATGGFLGLRNDQATTTYLLTGTIPVAQGGGGNDCGVPAGATAVLVNIVAIRANQVGNFRAAATGTTPTGGIVNFASLTPPLNNSNAVVVPLGTGQIDLVTNAPLNNGGPTVHARGVILGYFAPSPPPP